MKKNAPPALWSLPWPCNQLCFHGIKQTLLSTDEGCFSCSLLFFSSFPLSEKAFSVSQSSPLSPCWPQGQLPVSTRWASVCLSNFGRLGVFRENKQLLSRDGVCSCYLVVLKFLLRGDAISTIYLLSSGRATTDSYHFRIPKDKQRHHSVGVRSGEPIEGTGCTDSEEWLTPLMRWNPFPGLFQPIMLSPTNPAMCN